MIDTTIANDGVLATALAREAGELLLDHWAHRDRLVIDSKRRGDYVSQADRESEALLRDGIAKAHPEDSWLGEETGAKTQGARRWIVDPLDGTTNFLHGIGHWAISIALEDSAGLVLGVVHDPLRRETFTAVRDGGATLNGEPIRTSCATRMESALFGTGIPFGSMPYIDAHAADIARLAPHCAGVRRLGAAALDLAYVASGRLDGFWERRLQRWDIAAGLLLLQESGAITQGWTPDQRPIDTGTVITATPTLFPLFAGYLRGV